ncbi:bystin [Phalaenopsis equestris]|uniref:bystin n=1 Tax=Phalaenopsis equestris TaxID=78828 RepID=UPI0009E2F82E|nr:bystin [Phalaenopsis equestris]XP_020577386.1 bystin [Phalaenopsis equestris]XP_020577387.1 bystin [Phalaenopsis equestris]
MAGKKRKQQLQQQQKPQHRLALDADDDSVVSKKIARHSKQHQKGDKMISSDLSSKILKESLNQQKEILREEEAELDHAAFSQVDNSDPEEKSDDGSYDFDGFSETISAHDLGVEEINEEDEAALAAFFGNDAGPQLTLSDIIIKKIKEKDVQASSEERPMPMFDDGVIDIYKKVGNVLSRYTSGKVPKALQRIAIMERWEEILYITEPEKWSPNAMYQATRIFASRLNPKKAQRFYKLVILPRVREEIQKNKRLHRALYEALKKSLYKPAGFFKGILFPLCQSQTCSLIEAHIIGSIIQKVSIPPLHSSVALMTLADMNYYGTTSFFIKLLVEKKYALPYRVLDALVAHFMRFLEDERAMPVIWHQTLLAFVQRYKNELTKADKNNLDRLLQHQKHYLVTPEIRRELKNSRLRGEKGDITSQAPLISVLNKPIEEDRWDIPDVPMEED